MKQYNAIKAKYPGALLLFRVGDFYETFGEDAIKAARVLDITLTKRGNGSASEIELAGFPHHALDNYLPKLVRAGNRVAICDQLEDPKFVKGIVKRGVTELVTPGVSFNDNVLEKKHNNFLASICVGKQAVGVSFLDISTGEFYAAQGTEHYIYKLIQSFAPAEIIFSKSNREKLENQFSDKHATFALDEWVYAYDFAHERLTSQFKTANLKGFGLKNLNEAIVAAGAVLHYLEATEHKDTQHIASISRIDEEKYVWLDRFTIRNLELAAPNSDGGVPLIEILDQTVTAMGSRQLRKWMVLPLKEKEAIEERLQIVDAFYQSTELTDKILEEFRHMADLERLISKVAAGRINPRELLQLKKSLQRIAPVKKLVDAQKLPSLRKLGDQLNLCEFLVDKIEKELSEEAPMLIHQGGIIKEGVNAELDELRAIAFSGKDYLLQVQKREVERTGINSLKISYNKVFGYYLEVSNANKDKVPADWIRKQTLVNAERYITEELKVYEEKILHAEEKLNVIEQRLFLELVLQASEFVVPIQQNARIIAQLDCLLSFSCIAHRNKYVKPEISEGKAITIKAGRHPVIEKQLAAGDQYVPNDVHLDTDSQQIMIITGPNMAGKSALLRQVALITLMAQIGCFVPAEAASIGIVDKVFTRVGASDNLSKGESTFMVEMTETASILNNLSDRSLILMDEIGRGTSTYDGVSIAWAIVEYLHNHKDFRPKTLFATHYHELNQLAEDHVRVKNFNVSVKEAGDKIIFMRTLKPGGSEHSFGIHVAQLAGMPNKVVLRANDILHFLEKDKHKNEPKQRMQEIPKAVNQMNLFELDPKSKAVHDLLSQIDINTISPVEALLKLNEILAMMKK
ncbi:MAG TPA: DNA mismatch repair protein MutS [Cyclobacteriaceae bacterium]|nr:DNA mismatch repair protein MutS [Cyclobacteriaceae bacterium]HMV88182.1 DNA mismatch repair protein MutS [Cyclobacteriaceae bacterium]HMW99048.1 DNA mismatch repair protein MutS [Cyclobacteriaceae bacterium]HMX48319.1 DNA mismatch repair protein MutS [Cyclobacteriaceae bacterium]HMY95124.1 DNA mismatch repair protein MutS [Cyclobacteriaceae bacterium]